jgi:hypothetical protein
MQRLNIRSFHHHNSSRFRQHNGYRHHLLPTSPGRQALQATLALGSKQARVPGGRRQVLGPHQDRKPPTELLHAPCLAPAAAVLAVGWLLRVAAAVVVLMRARGPQAGYLQRVAAVVVVVFGRPLPWRC